MNRYKLGLMAIEGACNPSGLAHSIAEHCSKMIREENADTPTLCNDPGIYLMIFQLAHLMGINDAGFGRYEEMVVKAKELAK